MTTLVSLCRCAAVAWCVCLMSLAHTASAAIMFPVSGTSALGHPVSFAATLSIAGNTLTVKLDNTSPVDSTDAADVLTSFYFDMLSGTSRPTLTYAGAEGFLYLVRSGTTDLPYHYTPQTYTQASGSVSNIRAVNNGDESWQFRTMNVSSAPQLGFGIGTVGNSAFSPNGFTPQVVGQGNTMINFAIYRGGDIDPNGVLDNKYLVKNTATFTFTGVAGFTEAAIVDKVVFGLGTNPDSSFTVSVPEPAACATATAAALAIAAHAALRRRNRGGRRPARASQDAGLRQRDQGRGSGGRACRAMAAANVRARARSRSSGCARFRPPASQSGPQVSKPRQANSPTT